MPTDISLDLRAFSRSTYSQHGEDGILAELFRVKGVTCGYFCEFGAWDGQFLSNTYSLFEAGWRGCYIEGDPSRYEDLRRNIDSDGMALICAFVSTEGDNRLDAILARSMPEGTSLDLLSIDIDSDDLAIWESVEVVRPRVVVIEYNETIPSDVRFRNPRGKNRGNSCLSIYELGVARGYELIAMTASNLIFIDADFNARSFKSFKLRELAPEMGVRFFFGYDGTLMRSSRGGAEIVEPEFFTIPWTNALFAQPVTRSLRTFDDPGSLRNGLKSLLSRASGSLRRPMALVATKFALWRGGRRFP